MKERNKKGDGRGEGFPFHNGSPVEESLGLASKDVGVQ